MSRATTIVEKLMWLWVVTLMISGAQLFVWWVDRVPPFELLSYTAPPVHAGGELRIDGTVRRDVDRGCSLVGSRHMLDAKGTRYEVSGVATMTAQSLRRLDRAAPGELHLAIMTEPSMAAGPAQLVTVMQYACNPLQELIWPIDVEMAIDFEVLP